MGNISYLKQKENREKNKILLTIINRKIAGDFITRKDFCEKYNLPYTSFMSVFQGLKKIFNEKEFKALESYLQKDLSKYRIKTNKKD